MKNKKPQEQTLGTSAEWEKPTEQNTLALLAYTKYLMIWILTIKCDESTMQNYSIMQNSFKSLC